MSLLTILLTPLQQHGIHWRYHPLRNYLRMTFTTHHSGYMMKMTSAAQYLEYLKGKFETLKSSGSVVKAEQIPGKDFIVLTQDNVRQCGIIIKVNDDGLIARADMMPLQFCNR